MAETASGIAATARRPEYLQLLYWRAQARAERFAGRPLFTPDDDELVLQHYAAMRHQACLKEIEAAGINRMMHELHMMLPPPTILRIEDRWEIQPHVLPDDLPAEVRPAWRQIVALRDAITAKYKDPT